MHAMHTVTVEFNSAAFISRNLKIHSQIHEHVYQFFIHNIGYKSSATPPHTPISTKQKNPNQTFMILYHNSLVLKWSNIFYWLNNSPVFMNKYHNDIWKVNPCNKHNLIDS